jgi:hypothetical protein
MRIILIDNMENVPLVKGNAQLSTGDILVILCLVVYLSLYSTC